MKPCALLSLPVELRLRIYEYLYIQPTKRRCTFTILDNTHLCTSQNPAFGCICAASLLRTCRQINREATSLLYETSNFKLSIFGLQAPSLRRMAEYGLIQGNLTLRNIRRLQITLHITEPDDVDCALQRLHLALQQLDCGQRLMKCTVDLVLYWTPCFRDPMVAMAVAVDILALEESRELNVVEENVYTSLWREAVRVSCRGPYRDQMYQKFRSVLAAVGATEERQAGRTSRAFDLEKETLI